MWREYNVTTIRKVGKQYKVSNLNMIHGGGSPSPRKEWPEDGVKLDNSVARARTAIRELGLCNEWQWFVTLTLSPDLHDRYDLKSYHKQLTRFLTNQNKRRDPADKITYILVPEKHQDGAWHMHGLIGGLREEDLYKNDHGYFGWRAYERSFGYLSVGKIKDKPRCVAYVSKYVSKTLAVDVSEAGAHLYYRSRGLLEPELVFSGKASFSGEWDWTHPDGIVRLAYCDNLDQVQCHDFIDRNDQLDEEEGRAIENRYILAQFRAEDPKLSHEAPISG